ncbi:hypothetical protein [Mycetocola saprophilus]|uniref:hypothetical protein n=1 Tax=Mycetocola saprophilus TaxID=76636 RepID=UPI0012DD0577|nr:hypothetical protein [Mycetocola saprophilus]
MDLEELAQTVAKLETVNERRASLVAYRNRQIVEALDNGSTWVEMQRLTGLSVRGLKIAVDSIRDPK